MLCSKCSEVVRPVVAIDIDGTLARYHDLFIGFAARWLGLAVVETDHRYGGVEPFSDWCCRVFQIDLSTFRTIKLAYRQGGMKRMMDPYPDAMPFVNGIGARAEVWLTTNRPHDRFDRVDPDTREWLRRQRIHYDGLLYSDHKMEELAERVEPERVAFVIDDLRGALERASRLFPRAGVFLRRNGWNNEVEWPLIVNSLLDARAVATAHVQDWTLAHHFDNLPTTTD